MFRPGDVALLPSSSSNTVVGNVCDALVRSVLPLPCEPQSSAEEPVFKAISEDATPADESLHEELKRFRHISKAYARHLHKL